MQNKYSPHLILWFSDRVYIYVYIFFYKVYGWRLPVFSCIEETFSWDAVLNVLNVIYQRRDIYRAFATAFIATKSISICIFNSCVTALHNNTTTVFIQKKGVNNELDKTASRQRQWTFFLLSVIKHENDFFLLTSLSICLQCREFVFIDINNFEINRDIADLKHFSLSGNKQGIETRNLYLLMNLLILRDRKFKQAINLWFIDGPAPSLRLERPLAALATYICNTRSVCCGGNSNQPNDVLR